MRNLDQLNPAMAKPARLASVGAVIPLVVSLICIALASDAIPGVPFFRNPIGLFGGAVVAAAACMFFVPRLFNWGWDTKYFGASLFHLGSLMLMCLIPCLCIVFYSRLPGLVRGAIFIICAMAHVIWCRRFFLFYKKIVSDADMRTFLYQEEDDAVYYMQRADKHLIEKTFGFRQFPRNWCFLAFMFASFSISPAMQTISTNVGLPFIHVFLFIGTLPISLMAAGLATRAWIVFYFYPAKITSCTCKRVYVDMSGKPGLRKFPSGHISE